MYEKKLGSGLFHCNRKLPSFSSCVPFLSLSLQATFPERPAGPDFELLTSASFSVPRSFARFEMFLRFDPRQTLMINVYHRPLARSVSWW